jgi:hypothetical protein
MAVDDLRDGFGKVGVGIDFGELAGLCRPPNYAERFWKRLVVCAHLPPVERTLSQFHSA